MNCKHAAGPEKDYVCPDCFEDMFNQFVSEGKDSTEEGKIPIYAGCPNSGSGCFCTGSCRKVIGYRDPHSLEKTNFGFTKELLSI